MDNCLWQTSEIQRVNASLLHVVVTLAILLPRSGLGDTCPYYVTIPRLFLVALLDLWWQAQPGPLAIHCPTVGHGQKARPVLVEYHQLCTRDPKRSPRTEDGTPVGGWTTTASIGSTEILLTFFLLQESITYKHWMCIVLKTAGTVSLQLSLTSHSSGLIRIIWDPWDAFSSASGFKVCLALGVRLLAIN